RGVDLLAELAVAIDAKSAGDENVAVEKTALLLDVARVFLAARVEFAHPGPERRQGIARAAEAARAQPAIEKIEARKRTEAGSPSVDRLGVAAAGLLRNRIRLEIGYSENDAAREWRRVQAEVLTHEKRVRAREQVVAEAMLDFALEQHELFALMRRRIQRRAGEHGVIGQAHVRRDIPRKAAQHGVVAEMVIQASRAREVV